MKCRKCKGDVKVIKGHLGSLGKRDDVVIKCLKCGHIQGGG